MALMMIMFCSQKPSFRVNGDKLLWTNDLESLKNFLENVLKQQGKWVTPGGNTKHFKISNVM